MTNIARRMRRGEPGAEPVLEKIGFYIRRFEFWRDSVDTLGLEWAGFLRYGRLAQ